MSILSFLKSLFTTRLSAFEVQLLSQVKSTLAPTTQRQWDKQLQAINKIQRLPKGVEVDFYRMANGSPSFDPAIAFANTSAELQLAKVHITGPDNEEKLLATLWCLNGFLFSIEYQGAVSYFEKAAGMQPRPEFKFEVQLLADLSAPPATV